MEQSRFQIDNKLINTAYVYFIFSLFALVASDTGHNNLLSVNYNGSASDFLYNEKDIETFALYNVRALFVVFDG